MRLDKFHLVLQTAMGWTNSHLNNFTVGNLTYGPEFEDDPDGLLVAVDEKKRLSPLAKYCGPARGCSTSTTSVTPGNTT